MVVELGPELEGRLEEIAKRQGLDPQTLIRRTLEERWPREKPEFGILQRTLSPEEWSSQAREWGHGHRPWPDVPDEAITREGIYGDHP